MKSTIFFSICSLLTSMFTFGQTSTEQFETESHGSASFTDNGVIFNILSHVNTYDIQANYPGTGWNGTAVDNRYIDNSAPGNQATGTSFSLKTTSNLFKVNRFWVFASAADLTLSVTGTLTITGKLNGVTKFTQIKTTGFATSMGTTNGFTLVDLTNLNGQNYSNIIIDQLQVTAGGGYQYLCLDAFTWVKDSGVVLATEDIKIQKNKISMYPNPTSGIFSIKADENTKLDVYSENGQLLKTIDAKKGINTADISEFQNGLYLLNSTSESYKIIKK